MYRTWYHVAQGAQVIIIEALNAPRPGEHVCIQLAVGLLAHQVYGCVIIVLVLVEPASHLRYLHRGQPLWQELRHRQLWRSWRQGMQPLGGKVLTALCLIQLACPVDAALQLQGEGSFELVHV